MSISTIYDKDLFYS